MSLACVAVEASPVNVPCSVHAGLENPKPTEQTSVIRNPEILKVFGLVLFCHKPAITAAGGLITDSGSAGNLSQFNWV